MEKKTIYLLLFHGSARESALSSATKFTDSLRDICKNRVECCFLRGQSPDLDEAISSALAQGFTCIKIIQLFLLPGAHVNEDIPGIVARHKQQASAVSIEVLPCLVELPEFTQMIQQLINKDE